jgi:hypothetical protein
MKTDRNGMRTPSGRHYRQSFGVLKQGIVDKLESNGRDEGRLAAASLQFAQV